MASGAGRLAGPLHVQALKGPSATAPPPTRSSRRPGSALPARATSVSVARTTIPSAARSPTADAANPIAGGPARKPNQPIVETVARPTLAETAGVEAAARKSTGIDDAEACSHRGEAGDPNRHGADHEREAEPDRRQRRSRAGERDGTEPAVEAVADGAARHHHERECGVRERRDAGRGSERPRQVDGAPVDGGALGEHRAERRRAEDEDRPRRPRERRCASPAPRPGRRPRAEAGTGRRRARAR